MDLFHFPDGQFVLSMLSIVLIDLTLSGDNAVVIAAAVKTLPPALRKRALIAGAICAVIALVTAAAFATSLLHIQFLQIVGGVAILWIAVGLFREESPTETPAEHLADFWRAMWFIVVADVTMSTDNVLAVAAIAEGDVRLLAFGLSVSIPLVVFASGMLAKLMDKYPVVIYVGAALLGRVAGQMIMTDAFTVRTLAPGAEVTYAVEACGAVAMVAAGMWMKRRARGKADA